MDCSTTGGKSEFVNSSAALSMRLTTELPTLAAWPTAQGSQIHHFDVEHV